MPLTQDSEIKQLLEGTSTIAVVGYSDRPDRPSNSVAHALQEAGYSVYLVNPTLQSETEKIYSNLAEIPVKIDMVDIFRRPADVPPIIEEAIAVGAKAVWMQLGIRNDEAAERAEQAGLKVVQDRCLKVEHRRLRDRKVTK
jgi:uncharacterized protein